MWHPNVYDDGRVCISILHSAGDDPMGYETAAERWSPVHTVRLGRERERWWRDARQGAGPSPWAASPSPRGHAPFPLSQAPKTPPRFFFLSFLFFLHPLTRPPPHLSLSSSRPQVETIMISIISMLSSPNDESPANIDAAKEWREDRAGFRKRVARIVRKSQECM